MKPIFPLFILMLWVPALLAVESLVIYGSRQQSLMEPLLLAYREAHGVEVRYVQEKSAPLLKRLADEGEHSPADLLLTADIGVLEAAREKGLLQARQSALLSSLIPAKYRDSQGYWFGLSLRARMIVYAPGRMAHDSLRGYRDLAAPVLRGRVCIRSLSHVYNQSFIAGLLARWGEARTREWLHRLADNLAKPSQGGDRDQIRAVAEGECDVAVVNSYYYAMMLNSEDEKDRKIAERVALLWPDEGVHVNISGGGVTRFSHHPQLAVDFLEFLTSFDSQRLFAELNQEYPVVSGVPVSHALMRLGAFEADYRPLTLIARQRQMASELIQELAVP
ncbi:MAG: extracellular solute-binding protein [Candidatus Thiodiazotropha sp. (ex Myrtea spinifera)]|nr:extracellular solute-binding protein [Candidatus Thiodiazotropha sp. (ex Myrtea spinifera)]